jgi:hypothetical protein
MKENILNLIDEEINKYVVPYNEIIRREHPFYLSSIKYKINDIIIKFCEGINEFF